MNHYFVAYGYTDLGGSGFGSIEISINNDIFVPSDIRKYIQDRIKNDIVIINWKSIEANQLSPELAKVIDKEEDER